MDDRDQTQGKYYNKAYDGTHDDTVTSERQDDIQAGSDSRCGYGNCKPGCSQVICNNSICVLLCFCLFVFIQGFVANGVTVVNVSGFERRFRLTSKQSGLIMSAYDLSSAITVLPVTFLGTWCHKPRIIAVSAIFTAFGSFFMFIPHYLMEPYQPGDGSLDICSIGKNTTVTCGDKGVTKYQGFLVIGQLLQGVASAAIFSLGPVYLNHNLPSKTFPLFQGIMFFFAVLGPAAGSIVGGFLLNLYVDFDREDTAVTMTPWDPRWVGAWWVTYLASGTAFFFVALIIFPYPKRLPEGEKVRANFESEAHATKNQSETELTTWKETPRAVKYICTNPVFIFITLATIFETLLVFGLGTFTPKFLELQFGLPAYLAGILTGAIAIPAAALGNLLGGVIGRVFQLRVHGHLRVCILAEFICSILCIAAIMRCETRLIMGVNQPYPQNQSYDRSAWTAHIYNYSLQSQCNELCHCTTATYAAACYDGTTNFFSACYAGCQQLDISTGMLVYTNCLCLPDAMLNITSGACPDDCSKEKGFLAVFFFLNLITFLAAVPTVSAILRCVPDKHQSMTIGMQTTVARLLGAVPGPLLFGALFDQACVIWQDDPCDYGASCWLQDARKLSVYMIITVMVLKALTCICFALAHALYRPPGGAVGVGVDHAMNTKTEDNPGFEQSAFS